MIDYRLEIEEDRVAMRCDLHEHGDVALVEPHDGMGQCGLDVIGTGQHWPTGNRQYPRFTARHCRFFDLAGRHVKDFAGGDKCRRPRVRWKQILGGQECALSGGDREPVAAVTSVKVV